jgi:PHP family Zn ribbon phosphoesterase
MKARTFEKLPNSLTFMYGFIKGSNPTTPLYKDTKDLLLDMLDGLTKEVRELGYSADADYVAEFNKFLEDNSIIQK